MRIALTVALLLVSFVTQTNARDISMLELEIDRVDSLILSGDLESPTEQWAMLDSIASQCEADSSAMARLAEYRTLFEDLVTYVALFSETKPASIATIISSGRDQVHLYTPDRAGDLAANAFQRFFSLSETPDSLETLKYLRIARMFKIRDREQLWNHAREQYARAHQHFRDSDPRFAKLVLDSITLDAVAIPSLASFANSLEILRRRTTEAIKRLEQREMLWEREEKTGRRIMVGLGGKLVHQPDASGRFMPMYNDNNSILVVPKRVAPNYRPSFGLEIWYPISDHFMVGAGGNLTRFKYTSAHTMELIFFDFDVSHRSLFLGTRWLTRNEVGMRPFLDLCYGLAWFEHDRIVCVAFHESSDPEAAPIPVDYFMDASSYRSNEFLATVGLQFVPSRNSPVAVSSALSFRTQSDSELFIRQPGTTFGLSVELLL